MKHKKTFTIEEINNIIEKVIEKEDKSINSQSRGCDFFWHKELKKMFK